MANTPLVWDADSQRFYETGVRQGVVYPLSAEGKYDKGEAWNGLTGVTENPSGADVNDLYANDEKYLSMMSKEQLGLSIKAYTYPDIIAKLDGTAELAPGVYIGQQERKTFGFSYRTTIGNDTDGNDHGYKLHLVYGCKLSPSDRDYQTVGDSTDPIEFSWEVNTTPVATAPGFAKTAMVTIDSTKVDNAKLKSLEDILYGVASGETSARLPLPAEVKTLLATA